MGVVMPAHNEEDHMGAALAALRVALDELQTAHPRVTAAATIILDHCNDNTADIALAHASADPRVNVAEVQLRNVGGSRAHGVRSILQLFPGIRAEDVWIANTDADSMVPRHWLSRQLDMANTGVDAILGSVEPEPRDLDQAVLRRWLELHPFRENHSHVYGANLGIRASAYLAAGGFPDLSSHEDRELVEKLHGQGFNVRSTDTIRVITSGRTLGRAPLGFGAYLRSLATEIPSASNS